MKTHLTFLFVVFISLIHAQQNFIHSSEFYRDQSARYSNMYFPDGQYPKNESEFDLIAHINDTSKQYYTLTEVLFKKHLFEIKGDGFTINISPVFDFSFGRDLSDTTTRNLYQNTRGVFIEGDLGKNFSFGTEFYENQGRYTTYQSEFYIAHGELYPTSIGYYQQNAIVPGEARTKPFKTDGFDYAYAIGYLAYRPHRNILISGGNTPHFIGEGFRSLLLGNSNGNAPFIKLDWQINPKLKFSYLRARNLNLLRRVATGSAESYYEAKGFGMNYLTYEPITGVGISLFEGNMWSRGDSIQSTLTPVASYIPIPFLSSAVESNHKKLNSIWGLNLVISKFKNHLIYGQLVIDDLSFNDCAVQLGFKGFDYFNLDQFMLQVEYNYIPPDFYSDPSNSRLNYSHYNLPLAHILGNNLSELFAKASYEWHRIYASFLVDYSDRGTQNGTPLLAFDLTSNATPKSSVFLASTELGYRFNRKMNLCLFTQFTLRTDNTNDRNTSFASAGIKTAIKNRSFVF